MTSLGLQKTAKSAPHSPFQAHEEFFWNPYCNQLVVWCEPYPFMNTESGMPVMLWNIVLPSLCILPSLLYSCMSQSPYTQFLFLLLLLYLQVPSPILPGPAQSPCHEQKRGLQKEPLAQTKAKEYQKETHEDKYEIQNCDKYIDKIKKGQDMILNHYVL